MGIQYNGKCSNKEDAWSSLLSSCVICGGYLTIDKMYLKPICHTYRALELSHLHFINTIQTRLATAIQNK
jgi:hypothetical protein